MKNASVVSLLAKQVRSFSLSLLAILLQGCLQTNQPLVLIPNNWSPSLTQAGAFVAGMSNKPAEVNQRILSNTSQTLADISDAQLFIVYVRLIQTLSENDRNRLFDEQQQWLETREHRARNAVVSKGGTLAPIEYNDVFRTMTETRLSELMKQLNQADATNNRSGGNNP
jgi:uncharacterized protein YecT (DUF1311 family)